MKEKLKIKKLCVIAAEELKRDLKQREMEKEENGKENHVLVLPYPVQGHINPLLQFSKRLASKGLKVTLVTTISAAKSTITEVGSVTIETFSVATDEDQGKEVGSLDEQLERYKLLGSKYLTSLVEKYKGSDCPFKCLVSDSILPWARDLSKCLGLISASFYTQSLAVNAIYYDIQSGLLSIPVHDSLVSLPGLPILKNHELPSFVTNTEKYPMILKLVLDQFSYIDDVDLLLFNTFDKIEEEVVNWMEKQWPRRTLTIGPTVPSMYLDKRVEGDEDYGLDPFKPDSSTYMKWLDMKEIGSVVYVESGSLPSIEDEAMEELAWGLRTSGKPFLWVVRESEEKKLPSNFAEEILEKGLVVAWCSQLEVLAHQAIGCFITHCGWNSTLEALSFGVPMVAMPEWFEQSTNAKFVEEIWKVGIRVMVHEGGIVGREEIKHCIEEVLEGEKGKEMKRNAAKFREFAKQAVNEGGSSDKNIDKFLARLQCD